ncbi:hypothetical protein LTR36_006936 [Oleoguttula mirabilis]|uniref:Uncharacterized protein n=1 Tax=Oleoguttula mirabilis TaxID=1507867 RepID=A0AAV9JBH7_9PEZI|nr:hypothetical protein LTR36_006936 [Oleoguttula mirabilis]
MSFGFSPSDAVALINLVTKTYKGWKGACGEYADITVSLDALRIIIERIHDEARRPRSVLVRSAKDAKDLKDVLSNAQLTVRELHAIVERYKSLGLKKSRQSNWERICLGVKSLGGLRVKLSQHVTTVTAYLEAVGLGALARIETGLEVLPDIKRTVDALAADIRAGRREGSVMTTYEDDEKEVWKQFRRELIGDGMRSSFVHKHKPTIRRYLRGLAERGLLEEQELGGTRDEQLSSPAYTEEEITSGGGEDDEPLSRGHQELLPQAKHASSVQQSADAETRPRADEVHAPNQDEQGAVGDLADADHYGATGDLHEGCSEQTDPPFSITNHGPTVIKQDGSGREAASSDRNEEGSLYIGSAYRPAQVEDVEEDEALPAKAAQVEQAVELNCDRPGSHSLQSSRSIPLDSPRISTMGVRNSSSVPIPAPTPESSDPPPSRMPRSETPPTLRFATTDNNRIGKEGKHFTAVTSSTSPVVHNDMRTLLERDRSAELGDSSVWGHSKALAVCGSDSEDCARRLSQSRRWTTSRRWNNRDEVEHGYDSDEIEYGYDSDAMAHLTREGDWSKRAKRTKRDVIFTNTADRKSPPPLPPMDSSDAYTDSEDIDVASHLACDGDSDSHDSRSDAEAAVASDDSGVKHPAQPLNLSSIYVCGADFILYSRPRFMGPNGSKADALAYLELYEHRYDDLRIWASFGAIRASSIGLGFVLYRAGHMLNS